MSASHEDIILLDITTIVTTTAVHQTTKRWDHLMVFVDFTLGSLTDVDIDLIYGSTKAGTVALTDYDAYDANQTQIQQTFTADFLGAFPMATQNNTTRLSPAPIASDTWTLKVTPNGTPTSSSIEVVVRPFSYGRTRD